LIAFWSVRSTGKGKLFLRLGQHQNEECLMPHTTPRNPATDYLERRLMVTVDKENFPDRLSKARKARGLSQADLGKLARVTRSAVSFWEAGKALPEMQRAELIANILQISVDWLLTGEGKAPHFAKQKKVGKGKEERTIELPVSSTWSTRPNEPPFDSAVAEPATGIGGSESFAKGEMVVDWWRFPARIVAERFGTEDAKTLRIMKVTTDTMEPDVKLGCYVVIDLAQKKLMDGAIFAVDNGTGIILRRLTPSGDNKITLESTKSSVQTTMDKLKIIGRCVLRLFF
jgi:transcriptional regulator with XRE-family HTH domain